MFVLLPQSMPSDLFHLTSSLARAMITPLISSRLALYRR
jgi:hypothetical protein